MGAPRPPAYRAGGSLLGKPAAPAPVLLDTPPLPLSSETWRGSQEPPIQDPHWFPGPPFPGGVPNQFPPPEFESRKRRLEDVDADDQMNGNGKLHRQY